MKIEAIIPYILMGILGFLMFRSGTSCWKDKYSCSEEISGKFLKISSNHRFGITRVQAWFEYNYNGRTLKAAAMDRVSSRQMKFFVPGENYPLFINPKRPKLIRCTGKIVTVNDLFLVLFGGFLFLGAILLLLRELIIF